MAISQSQSLQLLLHESFKRTSIPKPSISVATPTSKLKITKTLSISASALPNLDYPFLRTRCCITSSASAAPDSSSPPRVFVKGLPVSTTEGRLKRAFSEFGKVSQVKVILDTSSKQSLGFAYITFTNEEAAQLAVKEMNGKFFDGKFIFVTIARSRPSKKQFRAIPYKF